MRATEHGGLRRAFLNFAAGGPVTSIGVGVLVLAFYLLSGLSDVTRPTHGPAQYGFAYSLFFLGGSSLGLGPVTLLPIRVGVFLSHGRQVLELWRPGAVADRHAAVMALGSYLLAGRRPRDVDLGLVAQALSVADGSCDDVQGRYLAYLTALDRGDARPPGSTSGTW